jgi:hypothetical protein
MTLSDLLPRAASLAPELISTTSSYVAVMHNGKPAAILRAGDRPNDAFRACLLYAILTEAKARGWYYQILRAMFDADTRDDPATQALSAFVALLEAEQEGTPAPDRAGE